MPKNTRLTCSVIKSALKRYQLSLKKSWPFILTNSFHVKDKRGMQYKNRFKFKIVVIGIPKEGFAGTEKAMSSFVMTDCKIARLSSQMAFYKSVS